jgi:hypothetical protein
MPLVQDGTDRVELPNGEWVEIKSKMSYGERQTYLNNLVRVQTQLTTPIPEVDVNLTMDTANLILLAMNIRAWNLTNGTGEVAPLTKENIALLDPQTADQILEAINGRNPDPKAWKSTSTTTQPSSTEAESLPES